MKRRRESRQRVKRRRTTRPKARKAPATHVSTADLQEHVAALTRELKEAREQQRAASEVLKVISSSPGELKPVFQAMLESATRICQAKLGVLFRHNGDGAFEPLAWIGASPELAEYYSKVGSLRTPAGRPLYTLLQSRAVVQLADSAVGPNPGAASKFGGARTLIAVPMFKDDSVVGAIFVYRQEVRPFTDKQIELVQNFAAQAVIAIENTRLFNELRQRTDDLTESLEQQTATSNVLNVISRSKFELQPVLDTIVHTASALCDAEYAVIFKVQDTKCYMAATNNPEEAFSKYAMEHPLPLGRGSCTGRAVLERRAIHLQDCLADPEYEFFEYQSVGKFRSMLGVPLLRDGDPIGVITLQRTVVKPFSEKQIELVTTFADQAVIAIENVRLFDEVQARTRELSESLEQQTATSEVLKVISSSRGELAPVFDTMLANATQICEAKFGTLYLREADSFRAVATTLDAPSAYVEARKSRTRLQPSPGGPLWLAATTKTVAHIADLKELPSYREGHSFVVEAVELGGFRTTLAVPMLQDNELVGAITIMRQEVRPFTDKQIELVQNFAAQAVIAIENTRLLNELRQRTDDLSESLEQQTATSEVLKVVSSSPGELQPVFETMLENAVRICGAKFGNLWLRVGDAFHIGAMHGTPQAYADFVRGHGPFHPDPRLGLGTIIATKQPFQTEDVAAVPSHGDKTRRALIELAGARTLIGVPMLKDNEVIGAIGIYRQEVRPFTDNQIELVKNFAAQAVIAIENTRLLNELRESLQQQTATADVLKIISSSPGELEKVFQAMLENATRICEATFGNLFLHEGSILRAVAVHGKNTYAASWQRDPVIDLRDNPGVPLDRLANTKTVAHIPDLRTERTYLEKNARMVNLVDVAGARTYLAVPMLKEDGLVGAIGLYREEVRPFTEKQIELVQNFAAQAVIAIENTRLLNELRESLQQQTATADVLKVISRSTFDLQTVLQTLVESAAALCDADKTIITRQKDGVFYRAEAHGFSREFLDYVRSIPIKAERGSAFGRALLEGRAVHIPDVKADTEYTLIEGQKLGDYRSVLAVPMLREGVAIGVLSLTRSEIRPFSEKQIELASTFADQAAIAIENVRLFESVEARTRELAKSLEDLRTAQDRLVQTEKLASLGQLTAGIAHEIKNPLNFVNNFSAVSVELIEELREALADANLDSKLRGEISELADMLQGNLDKVVQHGKRADAIVKNMLLHSRAGSGEHRPVDINALVEESLNLAYHGARAEKQGFNITMEKSLDPGAGEVDLFPQEIIRALLNLISNGFYAATRRKADGNGGDGYEPTLAAATRNLGDSVEITIRDNGTGIPPEVKEKMFNPFFTTKPAGEGTGLGLSISHDIIVKQHGGSIEVDTEPGAFTEFKVTLPRAAVSGQM